MSIDLMFKKRGMLLLVMVAMILTLFPTSNRVYAISESNLALNPGQTGYPEVTASYTCGCDSAWSTVNGVFSYNENPRDRWTNYGSPNETDWLAIDFGSAKTFNQIKLHIYDDGGGVQPPASYLIQFWNGSGWVDIPNPMKTPVIPEAFLNTVNFDLVTSSRLQVVFTNRSRDTFSGLVELEVFLHLTEADERAVTAMVTQIGQLPIHDAVALSDKSAITAARMAYDQLSASQKSLVTNLSRLTDAEAAIITLETALIPKTKDVTVLSAFSDATGHTITLNYHRFWTQRT
ncbi:discoidin domain-containing protein [Paenibacillus sp. N3.4]|uniref:discoidin domain-containing protein n=1 Tax=Paenibacillus sp. N3.4 TaxID=2603222 RepID=UPI0011C71975|nr:discoidin domain-containing protein [Paenibacillus sp. N3.4]TXK79633.1 discoidin domain-containing protein [Paenibacillus sp. N3.4]